MARVGRTLLAACAALLTVAGKPSEVPLRRTLLRGAIATEFLVKSLKVNTGALTPAFAPGVASYEVLIRTPQTSAIEFELGLDVGAVGTASAMTVIVDGAAVPYSPGAPLTLPVSLSRDGTPEDRTVSIEVAGANSVTGTKSQSLTIRILRPPDYSAMVQPLEVNVIDGSGAKLGATGNFDQNPMEVTYDYLLDAGVDRVGVELVCPEAATSSVSGDGVLDEGKVHWVTIADPVQTVSGQCLYQSSAWTKGGIIQGRTYVFTFRRAADVERFE